MDVGIGTIAGKKMVTDIRLRYVVSIIILFANIIIIEPIRILTMIKFVLNTKYR